MPTRMKMILAEIRSHYGSEMKTLVFQAHYDESIPEDQRFHQWTPNARLEVAVTNPAVLEGMKLGEYYYFDASPVPAKVAD